MCAGLNHHHGADYRARAAQMSPHLRTLFEHGAAVMSQQLSAAKAARTGFQQQLTAMLSDEHADAFLTLAAPGEAVLKAQGTGSPIFCSLWTLAGFPAICIPAGTGPRGLPLAVQLTALPARQEQLLSVAEWVVAELTAVSKFAASVRCLPAEL